MLQAQERAVCVRALAVFAPHTYTVHIYGYITLLLLEAFSLGRTAVH